MTVDEFIKRASAENHGFREEHIHIRMIHHLGDLGLLSRFEWVQLKPAELTTAELMERLKHTNRPNPLSLDLWCGPVIQPESEKWPEQRLYLELCPDYHRVVGRSQTQSKREDGYRQGPWDSWVQTNDIQTLEYWLRRQPFFWSS